MSQSADIADAIVEADRALKELHLILTKDQVQTTAWKNFVRVFNGLQWTSLGDGVHFDTLTEARQSGQLRLKDS